MQTPCRTFDEIELSTKYGISRHWVLRNDANKLILYKMSLEESKHIVIPPELGFIVPLFDGNRTLLETARLLQMINGDDTLETSLLRCTAAIAEINRHDPVIIPVTGNPDEIVTYELSSMIPAWDQYEFSYRLNRPFRAMLMLTNKCNTDCIYCYADRPDTDEMTRQEWGGIIKQLQALDIKIIVPGGGDPLARPDSIDIICDFIRAGFVFLLSSKCFVSEADARAMADAGFHTPVQGLHREFQISIDAADPLLAERMTNTHGYLNRVKKSVANLMKAGIIPKIKAVMTPMNATEILPLIEEFVHDGILSFGFSVYSRSGYRHDDSLFLSDSQKKEISDTIRIAQEKYPHLYMYGDALEYAPATRESDYNLTWRDGMACGGGFTSFTLTAGGKVILCEQVPAKEPFIIGDARTQSIMEIWNSEAMHRFLYPSRELFKETICYECQEFDPCHYEKGWCYRDALFAYGTPYAPPSRCPAVENPLRMS